LDEILQCVENVLVLRADGLFEQPLRLGHRFHFVHALVEVVVDRVDIELHQTVLDFLVFL